MRTLLEIKNLYGGYDEGINILQGINLTVAAGESVGIIGLNGSGKSTLGKAIMNQLPYRQGSILFEGHSIENKSTSELAQLGISLMHQGGVVFPNLTVWQNLQMALGDSRLSPLSSWSSPGLSKIRDLRDVIPLLQKPKRELMLTMADKLSGGQRHELSLAMTLSRQPKLVILDEPSAGLSPKAVDDIYRMLEEAGKISGITILLIEQNITRAIGFCERCVMIGDGHITDEFVGDQLVLSKIEVIMFNK